MRTIFATPPSESSTAKKINGSFGLFGGHIHFVALLMLFKMAGTALLCKLTGLSSITFISREQAS